MLAVLDPLLFGGPQPVSESDLDEVVRILRRTQARIPDSPYWRKLQLEIVEPLVRESSREIRIPLDVIRRDYVSSVRFPELPPRVKVWDFRLLFEQAGSEWVDVMANVVTGCVLIEETLLVTRLISGRNARDRFGPGECRLVDLPFLPASGLAQVECSGFRDPSKQTGVGRCQGQPLGLPRHRLGLPLGRVPAVEPGGRVRPRSAQRRPLGSAARGRSGRRSPSRAACEETQAQEGDGLVVLTPDRRMQARCLRSQRVAKSPPSPPPCPSPRAGTPR